MLILSFFNFERGSFCSGRFFLGVRKISFDCRQLQEELMQAYSFESRDPESIVGMGLRASEAMFYFLWDSNILFQMFFTYKYIFSR